MRALFNLIKTLNKEEKRLYQTHGAESRYKDIYQIYVKQQEYTKKLDQDIYQKFYADNTRSYYSMQKKALYEDLLNVLLEHSNQQHPHYQFYKAIAKAGILIEKKLYLEAKEYLEQTKFNILDFPHAFQQLFYEIYFQTFEQNAFIKYAELEHFLQQATLDAINPQRKLLLKVKLLYFNHDGYDTDTLKALALPLLHELENLNIEEKFKTRLQIQLLNIAQENTQAHKLLTQFYQQYYNDNLSETETLQTFLQWMRSCLDNGDFLQLNSIIYKMQSKLNQIPEDLRTEFLNDYYEISSLFHFYENDLPTALKEIQFVLHNTNHPPTLERCMCYRMAMLVAGDLQYQLFQEIKDLEASHPHLLSNPYIRLCELMAAINNQIPKNELIKKIEVLQELLRHHPIKQLQQAIDALEDFVLYKKISTEPLFVFPKEWQPILRVDLWLTAKKNLDFYYNLITEDWVRKRKVF